MTVYATIVWTNDSSAGIDDRLRFGYTLRTTSPDIKCLTSQTRPFWFSAAHSGRDSGPLECDIANHDAKITLCICGCLSVYFLSCFCMCVFIWVCHHWQLIRIHTAPEVLSVIFTFFFFKALAQSQATDCCCRWSCASQMEQHHFLRSLTGSIQELIRSQSIKPC